MARRAIPRRTRDIELWDIAPVGNRDAWRREMLQFMSLLAARNRRVATPQHLLVPDAITGKFRSRTVPELGQLLLHKLDLATGVELSTTVRRPLARWLTDRMVVPGERRGRGAIQPAAGLAVPHYLSLSVFNRRATRERFWAAFFYNALASDFEGGDAELAGPSLDRFYARGIAGWSHGADSPLSSELTMHHDALATSDPETAIAGRALAASTPEMPEATTVLPELLPRSTSGETMATFLCAGSVVLLRRSIRQVLSQEEVVGRAKLAELIETSLVHHAQLYYRRGMRVLNDYVEMRRLPDDCRACWDKFQPGLHSGATADQSVPRSATGTASEAKWVEETCRASDHVFVNAGRKELSAAKDAARLSLEKVQRTLAAYTVNRILLGVALPVAADLSEAVGEPKPALDEVLPFLDRVYADPGHRSAAALRWKQTLDTIFEDPDIPPELAASRERLVKEAAGDPAAMETLAKRAIEESVLSSRTFGRYLEVLRSLMGGGALPTNQDPKGMMARGGRGSTVFHLSLNDRLLDLMTALAALEASEDDRPLSFQDFVDFLAMRYHLAVDRAPDADMPLGIVSAAGRQSRDALRQRLRAMGYLDEFSDSSSWNRIRWGVAR